MMDTCMDISWIVAETRKWKKGKNSKKSGFFVVLHTKIVLNGYYGYYGYYGYFFDNHLGKLIPSSLVFEKRKSFFHKTFLLAGPGPADFLGVSRCPGVQVSMLTKRLICTLFHLYS